MRRPSLITERQRGQGGSTVKRQQYSINTIGNVRYMQHLWPCLRHAEKHLNLTGGVDDVMLNEMENDVSDDSFRSLTKRQWIGISPSAMNETSKNLE